MSTSTIPGYWTPRQAAAVLANDSSEVAWVGLDVAQNRVAARSGSLEWPGATAVTCKGVGKATRGTFAGFSCQINSGTTVFARVWSSRSACITSDAPALCPPVPPSRLSGDPRSCGVNSAYCMARDAARAVWTKAQTVQPAAMNCAPTSAFVYSCVGNAAAGTSKGLPIGTVTWTKNKTAWTMAVALA